jgi:hypothetical protein
VDAIATGNVGTGVADAIVLVVVVQRQTARETLFAM